MAKKSAAKPEKATKTVKKKTPSKAATGKKKAAKASAKKAVPAKKTAAPKKKTGPAAPSKTHKSAKAAKITASRKKQASKAPKKQTGTKTVSGRLNIQQVQEVEDAKQLLMLAIKDLISKGKAQGYLTYSEIHDVLPEGMLSSEQIDETLMVFDEYDRTHRRQGRQKESPHLS
jgi:hypothetical protein